MRKNWEKIKIWAKEHWPLWVLLLLSAFIYHKWLSFGIFWDGDYRFSFFERELDFLRYSAWDAQSGLGAPSLVIWMWFWRILPGFFAFFHLSSNVWDKFFLFWPMIFLAPLFSYLFAKQILKNKFGAFVAALVFSFNTYYLAINTQGHLSLSLAGTFAMLAMYFFWRYFDDGKKKNLFVAALVCLIVGGYDFRVFYILFFILIALPFWLFLTQKGSEQRKIFFRQNFSAMALFFGLLFLFNLFWLLPTAVTGSLVSNEAVARKLVPNNYYLDLGKALTLFHPFWNGAEPEWFDSQKVPLYFYLIPLLALLGAYWNRKNRKIVFWFFVALFAIFLSKQDALPLKSAYIWLHQNFPGFNAFREASKFYFAIIISYAILIGAFVSYVFERCAKKTFLKFSLFFLVSLLFLWNTKPILTGEMRKIFTAKAIPADELKLRDYVATKNTSFRTLWLQKEIRWASFSNLHPNIPISSADNPWKNMVNLEEFQANLAMGGENQAFFSQNFATRLLDQSNVRYLISDKANFPTVTELLADPAWKKIDLGLSGFIIFENQKVRPRIYLTDQMETIHREIDFREVPYSLENSSRWNFTFTNSTQPVWINFSEKYHPDWQLVCGDFHWYNLFLPKATALTDEHYATDAGLNAFLVDPEKLRESCPMRPDGKNELSLIYRPQSYLYLGGIISLVAVFISLATLIFWKEKSYKKFIK